MQSGFQFKFDQVNSDVEATTLPFPAMLEAIGVEYATAWPDRLGVALSEWAQSNVQSNIPTLSLFAGAGGLDLGFRQTGFDVKLAVEIEQRFVQTLKANKHLHSESASTVICGDIRDFHPNPLEHYDLIIGGPPCQTFSAAGRRAGGVIGTSDDRGMLFNEYIRILTAVQPKAFVFENVYGLTGASDGADWQAIQAAFHATGYHIFHRILDAADYGVPQHRERLFIVGLRQGFFRFPRPTHGPDSRDRLPHFSAGEAIADLSRFSTEPPFELGGRYGYLLREIPSGLNYSFYTAKLGHPNPIFAWRSKFSDFLYKADPALPVRTIKAQGGQYTGPFHWDSRPFTVDEYKRLQTFPDNYIISGGRQVAIQQIGNSVPPQLARIMALSVRDQVFGIAPQLNLQYLEANDLLSFRQRKRSRTADYARKAATAIEEIASANEAATPTRRAFWADVGEDFALRESANPNLPLAVTIEMSGASWHLSLASSKQRERPFQLTLRSAVHTKWELTLSANMG
ncbi:MAG: DNA cytosine methyltransferase [Chloroflexi bacterium]|nr:DNA cytosine methyltransferase [Chloroflexota bacterium]